MIQGGIDSLLSEGVGASAVSLLKNKALPVGTILLELVYLVDAQAPKQRYQPFLPKTPIRLMMDGRGNDLSAQVEFDSFNCQLSPVNPSFSEQASEFGTRWDSQAESAEEYACTSEGWRSSSTSPERYAN